MATMCAKFAWTSQPVTLCTYFNALCFCYPFQHHLIQILLLRPYSPSVEPSFLNHTHAWFLNAYCSPIDKTFFHATDMKTQFKPELDCSRSAPYHRYKNQNVRCLLITRLAVLSSALFHLPPPRLPMPLKTFILHYWSNFILDMS